MTFRISERRPIPQDVEQSGGGRPGDRLHADVGRHAAKPELTGDRVAFLSVCARSG